VRALLESQTTTERKVKVSTGSPKVAPQFLTMQCEQTERKKIRNERKAALAGSIGTMINSNTAEVAESDMPACLPAETETPAEVERDAGKKKKQKMEKKKKKRRSEDDRNEMCAIVRIREDTKDSPINANQANSEEIIEGQASGSQDINIASNPNISIKSGKARGPERQGDRFNYPHQMAAHLEAVKGNTNTPHRKQKNQRRDKKSGTA
jgi:hypothetical protein